PLKLPILLLGQQLDAHLGGHLDRAALRLVLLPRLARLAVIANASASARALGRAVVEEIRLRLLVKTDDIGLPAGPFHLPDRAELLRVGFQPLAYLFPVEASMSAHVLFETSL